MKCFLIHLVVPTVKPCLKPISAFVSYITLHWHYAEKVVSVHLYMGSGSAERVGQGGSQGHPHSTVNMVAARLGEKAMVTTTIMFTSE